MIHYEREYYDDFYLWLLEHEQNFYMIQGGKSKRIKWDNCQYMFSRNRFSFRELGMVAHLKKTARDSGIFNSIKIQKKEHLFEKFRGMIQYNYMYRSTLYSMMSKHEEGVFAIDLDSAYTMAAYILGIIPEATKDKLLKLKKFYKDKKINKNINALLGAAFASESQTVIFDKGKRNGLLMETDKAGVPLTDEFGNIIYKGKNELSCLWWLISYFVDINIRKVCSDMKNISDERSERCNKVVLAYYVDCLFLNMSHYGHEFLIEVFNDVFPSKLLPSLQDIELKTNFSMTDFALDGVGWSWKGTAGKLVSGNIPANMFVMEKYEEKNGEVITKEKAYIFGSKMFS